MVFLVRRPSAADIERFLDRSHDRPLSYGPIGIARHRPNVRGLHEHAAVIGRGARDFQRARAALIAWKHFDIGWVDVFPRRAPVEIGTDVAVLIRHLGIWSLNGARVLYHVAGEGALTAFGFAYGTLTNHAESGEELFEVWLDPGGDVGYRIRAVSSPQSALARIGRPAVTRLQARFRRDSAAAMARAMAPGEVIT
jgi:uncharacterized protein (UPF0548 family)